MTDLAATAAAALTNAITTAEQRYLSTSGSHVTLVAMAQAADALAKLIAVCPAAGMDRPKRRGAPGQ